MEMAGYDSTQSCGQAVRGGMSSSDDFEAMFELAPVSLWLEDYSEVRTLFDRWRAEGVDDLKSHLRDNPELVRECSRCIRVLRVNRRTLELFGADSREDLVANLDQVFRDDMFDNHVRELCALWDGHRRFESTTVNYALTGRRLDIQLHGSVLPGYEDTWERVLLSIEDVSEVARTTRALGRSEQYARGLFEHSPVSLWVEDFSGVKARLDEVRALGITDFRVFLDVHPEFVLRCMREIRVMDVNQQTLRMFAAADKETLLSRLPDVFRDEMRAHFAEQLADLWDGHLFQRREVINYSLNGDAVDVHMQFSVLPGYEDTWELVLVSLTDITARKKAEAYLEFLGKHDALTKLRNRSFFSDEINRLERRGLAPLGILLLDVNGLKRFNDETGHAAGDALLRRAGEVLAKAVEAPMTASRIGGDEFVLLMPGADEAAVEAMQAQVEELLELNNQFHAGALLEMSVGRAVWRGGERIEAAVHRADTMMYEHKKAFYAARTHDRRA